MARPGRLELPTLCLEAPRTLLPNLARGVANRAVSASWDKSTQTLSPSFSPIFFAFAAVFRALSDTGVTLASYAILYIRSLVRVSQQSRPSVEQFDSKCIFQARSEGWS